MSGKSTYNYQKHTGIYTCYIGIVESFKIYELKKFDWRKTPIKINNPVTLPEQKEHIRQGQSQKPDQISKKDNREITRKN